MADGMVDLEGLLAGVVAKPVSVPPTAVVPKGVVQRLNYSHKAMIDMIIANPGISQNQLALQFGYSASWISQVISSDAFQTMLAERTKELVDPTIRATVEEQFKGLIYRSLEILREKLDSPAGTIPDNLALRTAELSAKALGYGAKEPIAQKPVDIHLHLEQMGDNLTKLLARKKLEALETTYDDITPEEPESVKAKAS